MLNVLYEDKDMIVVEKPAGIESQSSHSFAPDMVSEIKRHIHSSSTGKGEPYVGVIHRLDKPVGGVMVYAKNQKTAASLSKQVQGAGMKKQYIAVVCGKLVDNVGNYVDYLLKDGKTNTSKIVDKGIKDAKRAELEYHMLETIDTPKGPLSLVHIILKTGRHHQIRVQMAGHGTPLWGDQKYNPSPQRGNVALYSCSLTVTNPGTGKEMKFFSKPSGTIFKKFESCDKLEQISEID